MGYVQILWKKKQIWGMVYLKISKYYSTLCTKMLCDWGGVCKIQSIIVPCVLKYMVLYLNKQNLEGGGV